jgi:hypothetical protein
MQHGYKVNILKGYQFNRVENTFDNYIKDIYTRKVNASTYTEKAISDGLLNNLLGRFGTHLEKYETAIVDQ